MTKDIHDSLSDFYKYRKQSFEKAMNKCYNLISGMPKDESIFYDFKEDNKIVIYTLQPGIWIGKYGDRIKKINNIFNEFFSDIIIEIKEMKGDVYIPRFKPQYTRDFLSKYFGVNKVKIALDENDEWVLKTYDGFTIARSPLFEIYKDESVDIMYTGSQYGSGEIIARADTKYKPFRIYEFLIDEETETWDPKK